MVAQVAAEEMTLATAHAHLAVYGVPPLEAGRTNES
jgi:hypothetical protein